MKKVVVGRNAETQAVFAKCSAPSEPLIQALRRHSQFVDHELKLDELAGETPGYKTTRDVSIVRWTTDGIHVVVVHRCNAREVGVTLIQEFGAWLNPADARYERGVTSMVALLQDIITTCGFTQRDAQEDDPFIQWIMQGFREASEGQLTHHGERGFLTIVVMQGLGVDPFVRTEQR